MREAGALLTEVVEEVARHVAPGVTTKELDQIAHEAIRKRKAKPAFLGLYGFPATLCTSVNEVVVHGIPSEEPLKEGDILSVDVGLIYQGFAADMARTFPVGRVSPEAESSSGTRRRPSLKGCSTSARAFASGMWPTPCRPFWKAGVTGWCGSSWATGWGGRSTRTLSFPTSASPVPAPRSGPA